ncbi:MAG: hypothetical protein D6754_06435 [Alphaproteobacteria bacterium]|nr:MAG: hypothetical protein D6754_06435 [Alphaproteobacteria bacterium]
MRLSEISYSGRQPVDAYGPGFFRVGGAVHYGPLLLLPAGVSAWSGLETLEPILQAASEIDVLLVGMGAEFAFLPAGIRNRLEAAGMGIDAMTTPAACRCFNVLLAEERRVSAALLPV